MPLPVDPQPMSTSLKARLDLGDVAVDYIEENLRPPCSLWSREALHPSVLRHHPIGFVDSNGTQSSLMYLIAIDLTTALWQVLFFFFFLNPPGYRATFSNEQKPGYVISLVANDPIM